MKQKETKATYMTTFHNIPPVCGDDATILILGSFPSVRSREIGFFYGHPQNRFWQVLAALFGESVPDGISARRAFLLRNKIAVWDVIASCEIHGSSDASIRNAVPNDVGALLCRAPIKRIFTNGALSHKLYFKHLAEKLGRDAEKLPSTSPANAAFSLERLIGAWRIVTE